MIVLSDFDGTLTDRGRISKHLLKAVSEISESGHHQFIILTGRPLAWGTFLLSHLPLSIVVTENGGCISVKKENSIENQVLISRKEEARLREFTQLQQQKFSWFKLSSDSIFRKTDRAINLKSLTEEQKEALFSELELHKLHYSCSNIHLNYSTENFTKFDTWKNLKQTFFSSSGDEETLYFGDSRNDQSMFKGLEHTIGVSNITRVWEDLEFKPKVRLLGEENREIFGVINYLKKIKVLS